MRSAIRRVTAKTMRVTAIALTLIVPTAATAAQQTPSESRPVVGGVVLGLPEAPPPPQPPPGTPVRVGGTIKPPVKIKHVDPVYPEIAQSARIQGVVIVEATIGPSGLVTNARVLRSIPLLDQA